MGSGSEKVQFHTSVLCAGEVNFFFAKDKNSVGQGYALNLQRSTSELANVKIEKCAGWDHFKNGRCTNWNFQVKLVVFDYIYCVISTNLKGKINIYERHSVVHSYTEVQRQK